MKQRVLTLVLPIRSDATDLDAIRADLRELGDEILHGQTQRFDQIPRLHFLSCSVLEARQSPDDAAKRTPACLLVELSFDGETRDFVAGFVALKRDALDRILGHCDGYPGARASNVSDDAVVRYLLRAVRKNQLVYLGTPGRSVDQIRLDSGLRGELAAQLAKTSYCAAPRAVRWRQAVDTVRAERKRNRRELGPAPSRPLRVRLNLANPKFRASVRGGLRLLAWLAFWLAGVAAAARWAREPWQLIVAFGAPAVLAAASAALLLLNAPRRLTARSWPWLGWLALREFAGTALWLVPLFGLVVAAFAMPWPRDRIDAAISWGIPIALWIVPVLVVSVLAFVLAGRGMALASAFAAIGLLAWRFEVSASALAETAETAIVAGASAAVFVLLLAIYAVALRRLEIRREAWNEQEDLKHLEIVTRREHGQLQSHLVSETDVEDRALRMPTLRAVLRSIQFLAWYWFNLGHLARIPSIHFARFLVLPERRSLVFLSNYDDRFDDYLGDFSGVWGTTAIWGNTKRFPRPFLLVLDGARRENLFKRFARDSQLESLIWYSAYPNLSVAEIERATVLREQMDQPIDDERRTGFLADLRRWSRPPLDDAALAALIEGL